VRSEKFHGALPRIGSSFCVVNLRALIIEEGVIRTGINLRFDLLAERFHVTL